VKAEEIGALFDEIDRPLVEAHSWWLNTQGYACTKIKKKTKQMHRMILGGVPAGMVVDHINRIPLDNRRCNLRITSPSVNTMNTRKRAGCASRHKGVQRRGDKWQVVVRINGALKWMGSYETEEMAYAVAAPFFDNPMHQPMKYGLGPPE